MLLLAEFAGKLVHARGPPVWRLSGLFSEDLVNAVDHKLAASALRAVFSTIFVVPSPSNNGLALSKSPGTADIALVIRRATDLSTFSLRGMCIPGSQPLGRAIIKQAGGNHRSFVYLRWSGGAGAFFTVDVTGQYFRFISS